MWSSRILLAAALIAGCQDTSARSAGDEVTAAPPAIEVHAADGSVTARVVAGHPCRATVDGVDVQIGGRPLVMMVGATRWTGTDDTNGTTLLRGDTQVARIFPADIAPDQVAVFAPRGIALVRVVRQGETASVASGAGAVLRTVHQAPNGFRVGDMTVTGTNDLLLAAVLSAPEVGSEVRALAACHRLLPAEEVKAAF